MKKFLAGVATLAMVAGGSSVVLAQQSDSDTTDATVDIENPFDINQLANLRFGSIIAGGAAGTATVDAADGTFAADETNVFESATNPDRGAGAFEVFGIGSDVTIDIGAEGGGNIELTGTEGTPMTLDLTASIDAAPEVILGATGGSVDVTFVDDTTPIALTIGGTLNINAQQAAETYTATIEAAFNFDE